MKNIIFIGGIHGVGKGTLCEKVCNDLNLQHLSASEVLKWEEISEKENKLVKDFSKFQELELEYSKELAERLNKPHLTLKSTETNNFNTFLYNENFT